jgi:PAS domain S-box-containing protein
MVDRPDLLILDEIDDGYYEVDLAGRFTFVNKALCRLVRMSSSDLIGLDHRTYMSEESAREIFHIFQSVFQSGESRRVPELDIALRGGPMLWVEFTVTLRRNADRTPIGFRGIIHDLTSRKKAERALEEANTRIRGLIQAIPDIVYFKDASLRNIVVNKAFEDAFGLSEAAIAGKTDEEILPPDLAAACRRSDELVLTSGKPFRFEETMTDRNGRDVVFETIKSVYRDGAGRALGLVGVSRDVTERRRMEAALKFALEEKEVLLKEVHHRVKNNMQVISSLLNLQARYLQDPEAIEVFADSQRRVRSMALIHEKLYQSDNLARIDFGNYIRQLTASLVASQMKRPGQVEVRTEIEDIEFDLKTSIPLGLIINELVSNSLKHAFPDDRTGAITIALRRTNDGFLLTLRDTGVGIPGETEIHHSKSMGFQLVSLLAHQLDGRFELSPAPGAELRVFFREQTPKT